MCGRYALFMPPEALRALFQLSVPPPNFPPSWNVAPRQDAPVLRRHPETGARRLDMLTWGLVPHFTKDAQGGQRPINARAETVATSGMFRGALAQRRCLVPANSFYEWLNMPDGKQPFAIARRDGQPIAFAGLWEGWRAPDSGETVRTFTIITTAANKTLDVIHTRMPVILDEAAWPVWLGEAPGDHAALLRPAPDDLLQLWPVSRAVNNTRNNEAALLAPLADRRAIPVG